MSLFPRFLAHDVEPLFRVMDEFSNHAFRSIPSQVSRRAFQPRFNVKETKADFQLEGEMPGIDQKDVNIEFVDPQTMTIKARSEHYSSRSNTPTLEGKAESRKIEAAESSTNGDEAKHSRQTTVEAEGAEKVVTPPSSASENQVAPRRTVTPEERYWVSERSIGEFHRSFNFPTRVDQDHVKASMKNGILSIIVPKITDPVSKKIIIE